MARGTGASLYAFVRLGTAIVALIALGTCPVFAQGSTATMSGVTHDATGGVIPGVTVTIKHTESGLTRAVQTTEIGGYRMPSLPVGPYEVTAEKLGFKQEVRRGINLAIEEIVCTAPVGINGFYGFCGREIAQGQGQADSI